MTTTSVDANATATRVDPVTASVIRGALENIAIEMGYKLMRMSYSSIIRESEDFGAAIIDANGNQLCESIQSTPLQSGPLPGYVRGIMKQMKQRGDTIEPGDVMWMGTDGVPENIKPGDVCEIEISGIGTLRNKVVQGK